MNLFLLFVSVAIGAALAWVGVHFLQRIQRRRLYCITPYVPAAQHPTPVAPKL